MKPNNKIKLKNATLSPVLSNSRDRGVCWNKGPVLSSKAGSSSAHGPTRPRRRSITTKDKKKSPWSHPEEECHRDRGWHELGGLKEMKQEIKGSIFSPIAFHEQWVNQTNQSCWTEWEWEEDSAVLDKDISIMKAPRLQDSCRIFPLRQPIQHRALWSPLSLLNRGFKKQISSRGGIFSLLPKQVLFDSGHQVGNDRHWGVWALSIFWISNPKVRLTKASSPQHLLGSSHSYREGAWKPVVAYFEPHKHGS